MRDLEARAEKALAVLSTAQPAWKMIEESLRSFSGLDLGAVSPSERQQLEGKLSKINRVLSLYSLSSHDDYKTMAYSHQFEVLTLVAALCEIILEK